MGEPMMPHKRWCQENIGFQVSSLSVTQPDCIFYEDQDKGISIITYNMYQ